MKAEETDWIHPDPVLTQKGRRNFTLVAILLIVLSLLLPFLAALTEEAWEPIPSLFSIQVMLFFHGIAIWSEISCLGYSLALREGYLYLRSKDGSILRVQRAQVLTDGKALLAGNQRILLGVRHRYKGFQPFYQEQIAAHFSRVSSLRLFLYGLRSGNVRSWLWFISFICYLAAGICNLWYALTHKESL